MAETFKYEYDSTPFEVTQLPSEEQETNDWQYGAWSGMSAEEAQRNYKELYALGTMSPVHFGIELSAYDQDGLLANDPWVTMLSPDFKLPWLAREVDMKVIDAQSDSAQVGHFQMNFLNSNSANEIAITFIETRAGDILKSAKAIKEIIFRPDGTQGTPSDYMMWLKIYTFDRMSRSNRVFEMEHLVALQSANVPLDASNKGTIAEIPLTFVKMFPMITRN